jgi:hypothetical protein
MEWSNAGNVLSEKLALLTTLHGKDYIRAIITCPDGTAIYTAGAGPEIVY